MTQSLPLSLVLDKIVRINGQRYAERIADLGITARQVGLLVAANLLPAPSQADLAAFLGVGPSAVVAIVDELEEHAAVRRNPDAGNRRRIIVTLTAKGKRLLREADRRARELDDALLAQLPAPLAQAFASATFAIAARWGLPGSA